MSPLEALCQNEMDTLEDAFRGTPNITPQIYRFPSQTFSRATALSQLHDFLLDTPKRPRRIVGCHETRSKMTPAFSTRKGANILGCFFLWQTDKPQFLYQQILDSSYFPQIPYLGVCVFEGAPSLMASRGFEKENRPALRTARSTWHANLCPTHRLACLKLPKPDVR